MKFGVREIANVVFKAKNDQQIGPYTFVKGQPVFYIDTAKTSTLEGAATTVYATGGRGNTRLIAWEGQKTLTFTVEDALLSPISFSMLSGAGLLKPAAESEDQVHFHQTTNAIAANSEIDLTDALESGEIICKTAPIYVMTLDSHGDITGQISNDWSVSEDGKKLTGGATSGVVMVDYYVIKKASTVSELQIDAEHFAGYYYVEADTLFRRQSDGKDLPANITFPNVKIQSNFTFSMAATGDPSTFTFTMDAFPGYTYFNRTNKVLCAIQIVDDAEGVKNEAKPLFPHKAGFDIEESVKDSIPSEHDESVTTSGGGTTPANP